MTTRTIAVVSAGLSRPSSTRLLAEQLAQATADQLAGRGIQATIEFIELRDHAHQVTDNLLTGFAPAGLRGVVESVTGADGVIAVTPIFNASFSGLFKSFFDVLDDQALADKPVLIAATGGTARHSLALEHALRPMFTYLHADVVGTSVFAATADWAAGEGQDGVRSLRRRIVRAAGELAAEVARRDPATVDDPFELSADFESMLAAGE
jgi:FMN reductase